METRGSSIDTPDGANIPSTPDVNTESPTRIYPDTSRTNFTTNSEETESPPSLEKSLHTTTSNQPIAVLDSTDQQTIPSIVETRKHRQSEGRGRRAPSPRDHSQTVRRSQRQRQAHERFGYDGTGIAGYMELVDYIRKRAIQDTVSAECMVAYWTMLNTDPNIGHLDDFEPMYTDMAFKAVRQKSRNPDTPNYREAMTGDHRKEFKRAMEKELQSLSDKGTWHAILRSDVPQHVKIIPLTWVFRIKRLPNGDFSKFKARICVRGDLQEETRETHAPVVRWTTIRGVLTFAVKHKLKTRQIDFENAFVQSRLPVDKEVYVECPPGFCHPSEPGKTVMKLNKSLYGMV